MPVLDNSFLTASTILMLETTFLTQMSHQLPSPSHTHTSCLKKRVRCEEKREISLDVREEGARGKREGETQQMVCALERNRGQVAASAQLCTQAKYPLLRGNAH